MNGLPMNLVWFRCDLRTTDNSALLAAADGRPCVALYLLSPAQWREHDDAPCKVDFWLRNLGELQRQLAALNIPLLVRDCGHWRQAPEVIGRLCRELGIGAVHVNQEYGVNEERRDQAVGQRLREQGVAFHSHLDQLFFAPGSVLTRTGGYFQVFSQFRKVCHERLYQALPGVRPRPQPQPPHALASDPLPDAVPAFPRPADSLRRLWPAGEEVAQERLRDFADQHLADYHERRDFPALPGTSQLSPYLAAGVLSPRQCLDAALVANRGEFSVRTLRSTRRVHPPLAAGTGRPGAQGDPRSVQPGAVRRGRLSTADGRPEGQPRTGAGGFPQPAAARWSRVGRVSELSPPAKWLALSIGRRGVAEESQA